MLRAFDLITIVIPPALPAAMSIGTNYAISRLKKKSVFCISPPRMNICGKINVMVFDKTGTLTEEGLDVLGVIPADGQFHEFDRLLKSRLMPFRLSASADRLPSFCSGLDSKTGFPLLLHALATCHSISRVHGTLIGDPMDLKMFEFTTWVRFLRHLYIFRSWRKVMVLVTLRRLSFGRQIVVDLTLAQFCLKAVQLSTEIHSFHKTRMAIPRWSWHSFERLSLCLHCGVLR
jgi:magnesium-transporting ATPase (P-type)